MSREGNLLGIQREAFVIAEFAKRDWETFSGNGNTSCDIIALKDGVSLRVEVKGQGNRKREPSGPCGSTPSRNSSTPDCREFDILVSFSSDGQMFWQRSILYKGESYGLPLREERNPSTRKDYINRAQQMEKPC